MAYGRSWLQGIDSKHHSGLGKGSFGRPGCSRKVGLLFSSPTADLGRKGQESNKTWSKQTKRSTGAGGGGGRRKRKEKKKIQGKFVMSGPAVHPRFSPARPTDGSCVFVLPPAGYHGAQQWKLEKLSCSLSYSNQPSGDKIGARSATECDLEAAALYLNKSWGFCLWTLEL